MNARRIGIALSMLSTLVGLGGCYEFSSSSGGGQISVAPARHVQADDVRVPVGYRVEVAATGLTFPTGVTFDDQGRAYVVESGYCYGEVWTTPRLLRIDPEGASTVIASGDRAPWTGVAFYRGAFYVAEGGEEGGGAIVRITMDGHITPLIENLPSVGDHHTNGPAIGPDGMLYFGIGTATNSAVVGIDNYKFGWLKRHRDFHDIPGADLTLAGRNFTTSDPFSEDKDAKAVTGAYMPFGMRSSPGQVIPGHVPCTGAILRISIDGGQAHLVAWGLRNPFGLAFSPEGRLFATENSFDARGSRPIWGTGDVLWAIEPGMWYGWPDYNAGEPLNRPGRFKGPGMDEPGFVLAEHPNKPPKPAAVFGVHSSSNGFDFSRSEQFGHTGEAFVAQFGDTAPGVGKVMGPVGYKVVRVDVRTGVIHDFAINRAKEYGPASYLKTGGLERPTAARFSPDGRALYVVDFGQLLETSTGKPKPQTRTGVLWRITRRGEGP
jgi:glucose/arabinose dehydrogenase